MQPSGALCWCVLPSAEAAQLTRSQSGQSQEENHRFVLVNHQCQTVFASVERNSGERRFRRTSAVSLQVCHHHPLWVRLDRCLRKACGSTRNTPPATTTTPRLPLTLSCLFFLGLFKGDFGDKKCKSKCFLAHFWTALACNHAEVADFLDPPARLWI